MLCFSNGMCFIGLTPLFSEQLGSIIHFCDKAAAKLFISGVAAKNHLAVQFRECRKETLTISLSDFAEDNDIRLIGMLELISETDCYLMLNKQLIGIIFRNVNECVMVIKQGESFKCKIVFHPALRHKNRLSYGSSENII